MFHLGGASARMSSFRDGARSAPVTNAGQRYYQFAGLSITPKRKRTINVATAEMASDLRHPSRLLNRKNIRNPNSQLGAG